LTAYGAGGLISATFGASGWNTAGRSLTACGAGSRINAAFGRSKRVAAGLGRPLSR
jgi:hypothetical protein